MIVYLASPYSHSDPAVRDERFREACKAAALLMSNGKTVFCPVAHSHPIAQQMGDGFATDHDFWMAQDLPILNRCDALCVLPLPGWQESRGVTAEVDFAKENGIPILYLDDL